MAIEISAQFTKFAQFAADSIARGEKGADTIARLDAEASLGGRTIQAKTGDKIGKWVRSGSLKETNDRVRELFRQTGLLATVADDATLFTGLQNFIGAAMLGRFGAAKLHAIQEALTGENAADLDTMLVEGARDWFARVDGITPEALDEAVMGKGGGKPTENFKMIVEDYAKDTRRQLGA